MKRYRSGSCIPVSEKEFERLKAKGKNPIIVLGQVELNLDKQFLKLQHLKKCCLPHTWIILNKKIIDITKNQFDRFNGIKKYIPTYYYIKTNKSLIIADTIKQLKRKIILQRNY